MGQANRTSCLKYTSPSSIRNRPSRESRTQALANLGVPLVASSVASNPSQLLPMSAAGLHSHGQLPSIKHKKKLQLKHEAQLRLENQHQGEIESSPLSPLYPSLLSQPQSSLLPSSTLAAIPSFVSQPIQKERIVLRLSRSDLQSNVEKDKKKKSKKKHKHHHHGELEQERRHSRQEVWSSTSGATSRTVNMLFFYLLFCLFLHNFPCFRHPHSFHDHRLPLLKKEVVDNRPLLKWKALLTPFSHQTKLYHRRLLIMNIQRSQ